MKIKDKYANGIIIVSVLFFGILIGIFVLFTQQEGDWVQIRVDGEVVKEYKLTEEIDEVINGYNGTNHIVIREGKARIIDATCPDGLCTKMKQIDKSGQSIICLPNKLVVEIGSDEMSHDKQNDVDVITRSVK